MIDELSQLQQRNKLDACLSFEDDRGASRTIQHPAGDGDSQFRLAGSLVPAFNPHQHRRLAAIASPP